MVLGEEHPDTAMSFNNVAANLNAQGRYNDAELLLRRGLEIMERALGMDHPNAKLLRSNLEVFLADKEKR